MKTTIYIRTNFEAFHQWSNAPEEVAFLKNTHRHIFHVRVDFEVDHNDRELEFFMLKDIVNSIIMKDYEGRTFPWSCEQIAEDLGRILIAVKGLPVVRVDVSEDLENGSVVEFN